LYQLVVRVTNSQVLPEYEKRKKRNTEMFDEAMFVEEEVPHVNSIAIQYSHQEDDHFLLWLQEDC
jgi:hypothetical protein